MWRNAGSYAQCFRAFVTPHSSPAFIAAQHEAHPAHQRHWKRWSRGLRRRPCSLEAVRLRRIVRLARRLPACSAGTKDARSTHAPKEGHEAVLLACAGSRWITVLVASAQHRSNDNAREGRHCSTTLSQVSLNSKRLHGKACSWTGSKPLLPTATPYKHSRENTKESFIVQRRKVYFDSETHLLD